MTTEDVSDVSAEKYPVCGRFLVTPRENTPTRTRPARSRTGHLEKP